MTATRANARPHLRLMIGVPSGEHWHRLFGLSLAMSISTLASSNMSGFSSIEVKVDNHKGSILSRSRSRIAENALSWGATHLLFVDSDMVFPANTIPRLLSHNKLVVACNCATKMIPATPTARLKAASPAGEPVYTDPDSTGLERVWRVGAGVMLINMEVFKRLPKPWFPIVYLPEQDDYVGEDWAFCEGLEKQAIPIYIDHDLSKHIGHVGEFVYSHDVVGTVAKVA